MIFEDSRYEKATIVPVEDAAGRVRATVVLCCNEQTEVEYTSHRVEFGDRIDALAETAYGDPEQWWRIADANPEFPFPTELPVGAVIRIPSRY